MSSGDEAPKPAQAKTPMSRFLKTGSGSDSSSSSDDDDESGDDSDDDRGGHAAPQAKKSRFIKGGADSDSDESSDEEKRVVKSARDKRLEELQAIGQNIENKLKIGDWVATSNGRRLVEAIGHSSCKHYADLTAQSMISWHAWSRNGRTSLNLSRPTGLKHSSTSMHHSQLQRRRIPKRKSMPVTPRHSMV